MLKLWFRGNTGRLYRDICCRWDQSPSEGDEAGCDPEEGASHGSVLDVGNLDPYLLVPHRREE